MNKELPLITVITITKNRPNLLERAINTVKTQTYPNIKHFIVIDDCPSTLEMLEKSIAMIVRCIGNIILEVQMIKVVLMY